jgi:hypothetical protein
MSEQIPDRTFHISSEFLATVVAQGVEDGHVCEEDFEIWRMAMDRAKTTEALQEAHFQLLTRIRARYPIEPDKLVLHAYFDRVITGEELDRLTKAGEADGVVGWRKATAALLVTVRDRVQAMPEDTYPYRMVEYANLIDQWEANGLIDLLERGE